MSAPARPPIEEAQPPLCPHCKKPLKKLELFTWPGPSAAILSVSCGECLVLLHMGIAPLATIEPGQGRIASPHRM
jgi:hypothetical protein